MPKPMDDQPLVIWKVARDLVGVRADVEGENAAAGQGATHRIDSGMCGERRLSGLLRSKSRRSAPC
jgi:hypothetical protein